MDSFYIKRGYEYYVYILLCSDGSYYTGVTKDVERRIEEHNEGFAEDSYTYIRRPVELKYIEQFENIEGGLRQKHDNQTKVKGAGRWKR